MPTLLDTSVLVRLRDKDSAEHADCASLLRSLDFAIHDRVLCAQVLIEYWVVATSPRNVNGLGLTPAEANADLSDFLSLIPCLPEPPDVLARWRELVTTTGTRGRPAHDARLVAVMDAFGINDLITLNAEHFRRFDRVRCHTPADALPPPPV